ncbi:MAG: methyltransferase domain-containing protein [Actinobacteria bacterium]|nr:methyltransferase domain-containing protein [Actinomycetota bacterium]
MDSKLWDERYATSEYMWTVTVNQFVERHLADLPAGSAIDLGAGEGRNAVWLAQRGWKVTAVDFSPVGLEKGAKLAEHHNVEVDFVVADATTYEPAEKVDLVVLSYLQLDADSRKLILEQAAAWLRPGGMVFVIAHDQTNVKHGYGGPPSIDSCYDLDESVAALGGLNIELAEIANRIVSKDDGTHTALDTLIIATRP